MTDGGLPQSWMLAVIRLPTGPSRHRVAVWRELRRIGTIPVGGGVWAAPGVPVFAAGLDRVAELVRKGDGQMLMLDGSPRDNTGHETLMDEFNAARVAEWAEFTSECAKFEEEIAKERRIGKLTIAELDEEEQSVDRLRRWFRELRARDVFGVAEGEQAEVGLKRCAGVLDDYAADVYQAVHAPLGRQNRGA